MVTIVDYGMGNLGSILNMFKKIGVQAMITSDLEEISKAAKILLPGVGAFDAAISKIDERGLREVLNKKALTEKVPVLGICLGMQLLTNSSEEGKLPGLGWIQAKTTKFTFTKERNLTVPHMGWNEIKVANACTLTDNFYPEMRFYFVHSYFVSVNDQKHSMFKTTYGHEFDSGIHKDNIYGAQFHPEKSHKFGMRLFENFAKL